MLFPVQRGVWVLTAVCAALASVGVAVHVPIQAGASRVRSTRLLSEVSSNPTTEIQRRSTSLSDQISFSNVYTNFEYLANINLGGQVFTLQIDTASSDIWVATEASSQYMDTGYTAELFYVEEQKGSIKIGQLTFNDLGLNNQSFILVEPSLDFVASEGVLGVGPFWSSTVFATIPGGGALPTMDRIFAGADPSLTYITFYFNRLLTPSPLSSSPITSPPGGDFTISELLPQWTDVSSAPQLPVNMLNETEGQLQRWQVLLDQNGIIGPNGQIMTSTNASAMFDPNAKNQLAFAVATAYTLNQVPEYVADAIYSSVPGARKELIELASGEVYVLPCDAEVNVSLSFGGQVIPIHPLDAVIGGYLDADLNPVCVGTFQPMLPQLQMPTVDGFLGLPFLRNVYTLINFGSFLHGASESVPPPFIQFLPITDLATAHQQFIDAQTSVGHRLGWISVRDISIPIALLFAAFTLV